MRNGFNGCSGFYENLWEWGVKGVVAMQDLPPKWQSLGASVRFQPRGVQSQRVQGRWQFVRTIGQHHYGGE